MQKLPRREKNKGFSNKIGSESNTAKGVDPSNRNIGSQKGRMFEQMDNLTGKRTFAYHTVMDMNSNADDKKRRDKRK